MSTGPTMGELTDFIREHLPLGFSLKATFVPREGTTVALVNCGRVVMEEWYNDPDDLPATVVRRVNTAREMVGLEPVEGTWERS
jgi:hypothetical protein